MWALFVITMLPSIDASILGRLPSIDDAKYTRIGTFENRHHCEIVLEHFYDENEPFAENEIVTCLRVDE